MPDVFGDYTCQCDRGIGFVQYNGECHAEYLQGPCEMGEQVVLREKGAECMPNSCDKGKVRWSDGECYPYETPNAVLSKLTNQDLIVTRFCTFCNCHEEDSRGSCLDKMDLPIVTETSDEDLLKFFTVSFPVIMSGTTKNAALEERKEDFLNLITNLFPEVMSETAKNTTFDISGI